MKRPRVDYLIPSEDDGLVADRVGPWAAAKYRHVGMYAKIFSTGMKNIWPMRVYLDLFSGAGHAVLGDTNKRVLTSPLLALTVPDRFSKYIYCEKSVDLIDALRQRAARMAPQVSIDYVHGDVNDHVDRISRRIPAYSATRRVLSFCFVDPYNLGIHFETIRRLGSGRAMDFLILLALGMDANRNWATYLKPHNQRVDRFLGDQTWRGRWSEAESQGTTVTRFLASEYASAMSNLGYLTKSIDQMIEIRTHDNNMRLYYLAFFSKVEKGYEFWRQVQKYSTEQLGFDLPGI